VDYFIKWTEVYTVPNQETSTVVDYLMTNFFCHFGSQGNCTVTKARTLSQLLQEVLQHLGNYKSHTTILHTQSEGIVEQYMNTVEGYQKKVIWTHQRDWDERLYS
jgi:hypothetical protein